MKSKKQNLHSAKPFNFILITAVAILYICIRLVHLPAAMSFGSDEGRDFLTTYQMYTTQVPKLIGPPSEYSINGRQFYFGPAPYYTILPALIIGNWNPLAVSYFLILLNSTVLAFTLVIINNYIKNKTVSLSFAGFCIFTPIIIHYTRSYWNPHFMFPVSLLLLTLFIYSRYQKSHSRFFFSIIGFLFGIGLQYHYAFILTIAGSMVWLFLEKKIYRTSLLFISLGFIIGVLPLILFELRNGFYNSLTFLLVFMNMQRVESEFYPHPFYFISLLPFIFFLFAIIAAKVYKLQPMLLYIFFSGFITWSLVTIIKAPTQLIDYPTVLELSTIIQQDHPQSHNYNIVDQLTKDNRAMALRYLLTIKGFPPLGVVEYPQAPTLYVYTKTPLEDILNHPAYELQSEEPLELVNTWETKTGITVFKLKKL